MTRGLSDIPDDWTGAQALLVVQFLEVIIEQIRFLYRRELEEEMSTCFDEAQPPGPDDKFPF